MFEFQSFTSVVEVRPKTQAGMITNGITSFDGGFGKQQARRLIAEQTRQKQTDTRNIGYQQKHGDTDQYQGDCSADSLFQFDFGDWAGNKKNDPKRGCRKPDHQINADDDSDMDRVDAKRPGDRRQDRPNNDDRCIVVHKAAVEQQKYIY